MRRSTPRLLAVAAAASLLAGCRVTADTGPAETAVTDTAAGDVPMRLVGPGGAALMVPAVVNGDTLDLVLDTGATLTCLDRAVVERLGLEPAAGAHGYGMGVQGRGAMTLIRIDSIHFGGTTAYDIMGCSLDLEHLEAVGARVDGLLGLNVLKEFRVVLDFPAGMVRLEGGAAER